MSDYKLSIGQRLENYRRMNNFTLQYLADKLEVHIRTYQRWENDEINISYVNLIKIIDLFEENIELFLQRTKVNETNLKKLEFTLNQKEKIKEMLEDRKQANEKRLEDKSKQSNTLLEETKETEINVTLELNMRKKDLGNEEKMGTILDVVNGIVEEGVKTLNLIIKVK